MRSFEERDGRGGQEDVAAPTPADRQQALTELTLTERSAQALTTQAVMRLQRSAGNAAVGTLLDEEEHPVRSPVLDVVGRGGGQALDGPTRSGMESAFGHDFSGVRLHTGSEAAASARSVQAKAYTVGDDIVFGSGLSPTSGEGRHTLAHELTHVVQQRSGPVDGAPAAGGISISDPSDRFERAAEATAAEVMAGGSASGAAVQRQEELEDEELE